MFLTKKNLEDLGCKNVASHDQPAAIINGNAYPTRVRIYENLEKFKSRDLFLDACNGTLLIICENLGEDIDLKTHTGKVMLRLFDFSPKEK